MSQQTFMSSAAIMGTTLQNMGFTIQSPPTSLFNSSRTADLAIAFGKRPQDALLAITAAMRGERDTIEKFGIAIKQVDVNARISALGLDTSTAAARKNAEAMAIVQLVLGTVLRFRWPVCRWRRVTRRSRWRSSTLRRKTLLPCRLAIWSPASSVELSRWGPRSGVASSDA